MDRGLGEKTVTRDKKKQTKRKCFFLSLVSAFLVRKLIQRLIQIRLQVFNVLDAH